MRTSLKKTDSRKVLFNSALDSENVKSKLGLEFHQIIQRQLKEIDNFIKSYLPVLTCDNIRELYIALFGELKRWRSNSCGFTGFTEFIIFRIVYHLLEEKGEKFDCFTNDGQNTNKNYEITHHPTKFVSKNYEIGQGIELKFDNSKRKPDIYVKGCDGQLISIIQIKTYCGEGQAGYKKEVKTFKLIKDSYPNVKGLFISFSEKAFPEKGGKILSSAGIKPMTLPQEGNKLIRSVLEEYVK